MANETMREDYPDSDQRYAVCQSQWDDKEDKDMAGKAGKAFWQFKPQAATKSADLTLYGPISSTTWWGDEVTPKAFSDELKALGDIDNLNIHIFSEGGDPFAAHAIHAMLRAHKAYKTVYVEGLAASAASLIVMAGDKVIMFGNSILMVHNPWAFAIGNSAELRKKAEDLDKVRDSMLVTYQAKTELSKEEIVALLDVEKWMTAQEAVDYGFADEVAEEKQIAASLRADGKLIINGREVEIAAYRNFPKDRFPAATPEPPAVPSVNPPAGPMAKAPDPPKVDPPTTNPAPVAQAPAGDSSADGELQTQLDLLRMRAQALQVDT
ncbi:MAG: ATP-dependent Clp protease proteolytic subunit, partial [Phycisphaerae bacterium]|nr:ATP-dependent Clp protease proteolytic subunit [Phycisphaerae bacterium]